MAEGTRLRELNEHMTIVEEKMQKLTSDYQGRVKELTEQINDIRAIEQRHYEALQADAVKRHEVASRDNSQRHEELLRLLAAQATVMKATAPQPSVMVGNKTQGNKGKGILPPPDSDMEWEPEQKYNPNRQNNGPYQHIPLPKLKFPSFSGNDPRTWIENCEQYFGIFQIPPHQWLGVATMHLSGRARTWKHSYFINQQGISWGEFTVAICKRFSQMGERYLVREFSNLKQTATVEIYQEKFEDLRRNYCLTTHSSQEHMIACYISGLKEELISFMDIAHPNSLEEAYEQAKLHERALATMNKRNNRSIPRFTGPYSSNLDHKAGAGAPSVTYQPKGIVNPYPTDKALIEQRRAAGQCFRCGEKYQPGHRCSGKSLSAMEGMQEILEVYDEDCLKEDGGEEVGEEAPEEDTDLGIQEMGVSVHALSGERPQDTIKVQGESRGRTLTVLIDTGSTHSFIDIHIARDIKAPLVPAPPLVVTVANGQKVLSKLQCPAFAWHMQGQEFKANLRVIRLEGSSIVLGIDWLRSYGKVTFDFQQNSIAIAKDGQPLVLKGISEGAKLKLISARQWYQEFQHGECCVLSHCAGEVHLEEEGELAVALLRVLEQYSIVFEEPRELPPQRATDHRIPLEPGATAVNVRPYRHSYEQKEEIEKQVKEMLSTSIIQVSNSPFASPVLLVKKKDGSWRMCIDYRQLNKVTIKDKFPIPVIDDLLDELRGAKLFFKLDLRSGYHQIRVYADDIPKTAFRTHQGHYEFKVMPFGLTNAPATFQSLMNTVFGPYLRKFVLVFFDDILVFSQNLEDHIVHLTVVLEELKKNQLFAKKSKCTFGKSQIEYLGYIISGKGVATDPSKVEAMTQWPIPKSVKGLRGFLGLTGYCRKFIKGYGAISKPLTELLQKDQFQWSPKAQQAFEQLKDAMTKAPVLALPDFGKSFTLEVDASGEGIGAVLSQEGRPIAYLSKAIKGRNLGLQTYEKEFLAILMATQKWRHYLLTKSFIIKTDHESLKYLLEQRIVTPMQQKGMLKLMGFDYTIAYRKGRENVAADALSRREVDQGIAFAMTAAVPAWVSKLEESYSGDPIYTGIIEELSLHPGIHDHFTYNHRVLRYKGKICVGATGALRNRLLEQFHDSALGGHSGTQHTYQRIKGHFHWKGLKKDVKMMVQGCDTCARSKSDNQACQGLLQPLPIPTQIWEDISMDFIESLPLSKGKDTILVVVDRLTKYAHFIPLKHPFTAVDVAQSFTDTVFRLHGCPRSIVSDQDKVFTSHFWKELFRYTGTQLRMSTSYYPETDGQTERVNRCLETYLRCMCSQHPSNWCKHLPLAEWWYNTNYHSSLGMTPYMALYGTTPPITLVPHDQTHVPQEIKDWAQDRERLTRELKDRLQLAQNRMRQQADKHRRDKEYTVGSRVYLKLQSYRQLSVAARKNPKLAARYYGPFEIIGRVGPVAYRLQLPEGSQIHPVFHVSLLKPCPSSMAKVTPTLPLVGKDGQLAAEPEEVLERRMRKQGDRAITEVLVKWANLPVESATWQDYWALKQQFSSFDP